MVKKILSKEALSLPEMKKALEDLMSLSDEELNTIQKKALDYVSKFSKIDYEKAIKIKKRLIEELGIDEEKAVQIINIMPKTIDEVKEIFHERIIIGELSKKILDILWSE